MRIAIRVVLVLVLVAAGVFAVQMIAAESGEVVVVRARTADDGTQETRLWIVDDDEGAWLRGGHDGSSWFQNLDARPDVEVERGGETLAMRAVPSRDPADRARINALMADKYGWAETLIGALVGGRDAAIPIRLEPR